jgi:hypothetical protein
MAKMIGPARRRVTLTRNSDGYLGLHLSRNNEKQYWELRQFMMLAFVGEPAEGEEVRGMAGCTPARPPSFSRPAGANSIKG